MIRWSFFSLSYAHCLSGSGEVKIYNLKVKKKLDDKAPPYLALLKYL